MPELWANGGPWIEGGKSMDCVSGLSPVVGLMPWCDGLVPELNQQRAGLACALGRAHRSLMDSSVLGGDDEICVSR